MDFYYNLKCWVICLSYSVSHESKQPHIYQPIVVDISYKHATKCYNHLQLSLFRKKVASYHFYEAIGNRCICIFCIKVIWQLTAATTTTTMPYENQSAAARCLKIPCCRLSNQTIPLFLLLLYCCYDVMCGMLEIN